MTLKDTFKSLIALKQSEIPYDYKERELVIPTDLKKIITVIGARRCGKSTLMELAVNHLLEAGIDRRRVLWLGFDDERFDVMKPSDFDTILEAYMEMYPEIPIRDVYFFFDEIQRIDGWELFVLRLFKSYSKHIFITGSNADMLSTEISTELRGWPLEYKEYPLSFTEYCSFLNVPHESYLEQDIARLKNTFRDYVQCGGYPEVTLMESVSIKNKILQTYFDTIILRDMMEHYGLTNPERIKYVIKRLMAGITKPASINAIYKDMQSQGRKVTKDELYVIADVACKVFLLHKVTKFDDSFSKETSALPKYYCIDNGLRQSVLLPRSDDRGKLLENAVYLHLLRNQEADQKICYFSDKHECDFIVQQGTEVKSLVQVSWDIRDEETRKRELDGLEEANKRTHCQNLVIVTFEDEEAIETSYGTVQVVPAWKWFRKTTQLTLDIV